MVKKAYLLAIIGILTAIITLVFVFRSTSVPEDNTLQSPSESDVLTGWQTIDAKRYYFHQDGTMAKGWIALVDGQYYISEDGALTGPQTLETIDYLFDDAGRLGHGLVETEGRYYWADAQGHPQSGWHEQDGISRYFDEDGQAVTGWAVIDSFRFYFHEDGTPAAGQTDVDGKTCYFASNGQELPFVNLWHPIDPDYTVDLVSIDSNHQIAAIAYDDYQQMISDCREAGLNPAICSAYRTQEYQQMLFDRKVAYYRNLGKAQEEAEKLAGFSVAYPGTSEHQLGLALDIVDNGNWNLDESQAETATQKWLMEHSWEYGWILRYPDGKSDLTGIIYEPWHYRYVGKQLAAELHGLDVCLEEYIDLLTSRVS